MITIADGGGRLVTALVMGAIIGYERQWRNKSAGLRTHALVSLGACLTMIVSLNISLDFYFLYGLTNADPERIAAQVISGIGFLGAGAIMKEGFNIIGLTTAASLWIVAAVGLAVGGGYWAFALLATILSYATLKWLSKFEKAYIPLLDTSLLVTATDELDQIGRIVSFFGAKNIRIKDIHVDDQKDDGVVLSVTLCSVPRNISKLIEGLLTVDGVKDVKKEVFL